MSGNVAGGTPGPGLFARLAQRASGAKAELEPRLDPRYAPATPGVRGAGLEVIEAEVPAADGAERPRAAGPGLRAEDQPTLALRRPAGNPSLLESPAVARFEPEPVRRSGEHEQEPGERDLRGAVQGAVNDDAPAERWSTSPLQPPEVDTGPVGGPPARTVRTTPAMPEAPAAAERSRPVRDTSAAVRPRAVASEIVTPRIADTRAAPALDVEVDAVDDGIPWSLLTGPIEAAAVRHDPRGGKEGGRWNPEGRALEPLNDGRAMLGAARSVASPSPQAAEPAPEPDEIHVHIGRIEVAAPPVAPPRAARPRRQPRITLNDYLGLGSSRGGRR